MRDTLPWVVEIDTSSSSGGRAYVRDRHGSTLATCYTNGVHPAQRVAELIIEAVNAHFEEKSDIPVVTKLIPDFQTALELSEILSDTSQRRVLSRFMTIATTHQHEDKRNAFVTAVRDELKDIVDE